MRYAIVGIKGRTSYGITIGSRVRPDSNLRELITSQIDTAMESLGRKEGKGYGVTILPDWDPLESGSSEIPTLEAQKRYLIFGILYSAPGSAESLTDKEVDEYREQLGAMFGKIAEGGTRIALVILRDCTVTVIEHETPAPAFLASGKASPRQRY